jgi:hypothetical protein
LDTASVLALNPAQGLEAAASTCTEPPYWISGKSFWANVYPLATLAPMNKKDAGMRIRVDRELREQFLAVCQQEDRPAAQVLREFMRDYVSRERRESNDNSDKSTLSSSSGAKQ